MAKRKNKAAEDQEQDATDTLRNLAAAAEAEHEEEAPRPTESNEERGPDGGGEPAPAVDSRRGPETRADVCTVGVLYGGPDERLARVLKHTARELHPEWRVEARLVGPSPLDQVGRLRAWREFVDELADGDELLLLDPATFVVASLEELFEREFDLAVLEDLEASGALDLVALRVTARTRELLVRWADQAAEVGTVAGFRRALDDDPDLEVAPIPTSWLAGPDAWADREAVEASRVVSLRGDLRGNILRTSRRVEELDDLVAAWSVLELRAGRAEDLEAGR